MPARSNRAADGWVVTPATIIAFCDGGLSRDLLGRNWAVNWNGFHADTCHSLRHCPLVADLFGPNGGVNLPAICPAQSFASTEVARRETCSVKGCHCMLRDRPRRRTLRVVKSLGNQTH
jgi:hypothetical protein